MSAGEPASYLTLEAGTQVVSADGRPIGTVVHVLADEEKDIFDGLVVDTETGLRFADAPHVADIRAGTVTLSLTAAQAASLPEPSANPPALDSGNDLDSGLHHRLRRAWDLISGNY